MEIDARNVNEAWHQARYLLDDHHITRPSRVGEVWEYPEAVVTRYERPWERVLFDKQRDCNPFFHFFEGLWMLAGRNDVAFPLQFNKRFSEFSDNGITLHGAYGYRWRRHFKMGHLDWPDQLGMIINMLRNNPDDRRAVLQMWDPACDLEQPKVKDLPCNTTIYFKIREDKLLMTVCNRSNDIIWGLYGANAVHMSMLQEYMAGMIGVPVGPMTTLSDSFHAYTERWNQYVKLSNLPYVEPYEGPALEVNVPLVVDRGYFDLELKIWLDCTVNPQLDEPHYRNPIFPSVAWPLFRAWQAYKEGDLARACAVVGLCKADDWRLAATNWLLIRVNNREQKAGVAGAKGH